MNIRQRIFLLISIAFLALAAIGTFAVFRAKQSETEVRVVTEGVVPSAIKSVELLTRLKDVQITTLGLVSASDPATMEQALKAVASSKAELKGAYEDQLRHADSAAQTGLVKQAQESLANYFAAIDDTAKFAIAGQKEMAEASLGATVDQYLREQGEILRTLQVEKARSKDEAIASLNADMSHTQSTLMTVTITAVLGLSALGFVLYRQIVRPLAGMEHKMTAIATSQDFTQRMPIDRHDEIGKSMVAFNAMIGKIQESAELVRQKAADIHAMLHGVPQGILTIEAGGTVHPQVSEHLKVIMETDDFAGRSLMAVVFEASGLSADGLSQVDAAIAACLGEDAMNFDFNAHLLPTEIQKTLPSGAVKVLDLNWSPMVGDDGLIHRLLLCVRDVTELRALARAAQAQQRELSLIGEILAVRQERFEEFLQGSMALFEENAALIAHGDAATDEARSEAIGLLFRNMHTVKGNARTHGLMSLADAVHHIEDAYDRLRQGEIAWNTDQLVRELTDGHAVLQEYARINETKLGRRGPGRRGEVEKFLLVPKEQVGRMIAVLERAEGGDPSQWQGGLHQARAWLRRLGTERLEDILSPVLDSLPDLARELQKPEPVVVIHDRGIALHSQVAGLLRNVFMHLCRNALDHGFEPEADRVALGKPAHGRIDLAVDLGPEGLSLVLGDDGRGLALAKVRAKAVAQSLIDADALLDDASLARLVFEPGFSTAASVTGISGRGVGMDAVKALIEGEGGRIALDLLPAAEGASYRAFRTVIILPARLAQLPESAPELAHHA